MTTTIAQMPREKMSYEVRRVMGPTVPLNGIDLGPLERLEQMRISVRLPCKSPQLGARLKRVGQTFDPEIGVTFITWTFADAEMREADATACDRVLQAATEEWVEEAWLRLRAMPLKALERLDGGLFDQLRTLPRFRVH